MDANEKIREGEARDFNPNEIDSPATAEAIKSEEKEDTDESGFAREQSQTPAVEHIEPRISQIDQGTKDIQIDKEIAQNNVLQTENEDVEHPDSQGYMNDANSNTDRDTGAQTNGGWDAETSRTSRHK